MYMCMYVDTCVHSRFVCMYVHMYVCMYVCMFTCMYACIYIYIYIYVYISVRVIYSKSQRVFACMFDVYKSRIHRSLINVACIRKHLYICMYVMYPKTLLQYMDVYVCLCMYAYMYACNVCIDTPTMCVQHLCMHVHTNVHKHMYRNYLIWQHSGIVDRSDACLPKYMCMYVYVCVQ